MMASRGRLRAWSTAAIAVAALLVAGVVGFAVLPPRQTDDVGVPPDDASPEQVVRAYLAALDAHDCSTAEAVVTPEAEESARSWCAKVSSLTEVAVDDGSTDRPGDTGHKAPQEVVRVPVSFDLDWRLFRGDVSMPEGPTTWTYSLVRDSPEAPWRIFGQGNG